MVISVVNLVLGPTMFLQLYRLYCVKLNYNIWKYWCILHASDW